MIKGTYGIILRHFTKVFLPPGNLTYTRAKSRTFATMTENIKIGTHDGCFHCDEALACFLLKSLPRYKDAVIVRDFNESVSTIIKKPGYEWTMRLSSAGLIYCHFGHEIIKLLHPEASDSDVEIIFKYIYKTFIQEIDGIDNGVPMFSEEPLYRIVTHLSSRVSYLNPVWNSKNVDPDKQFLKAVELTGQEFVQHVNYAANVWLPARSIVQEAIEKRFEVDPSGEIVVLSQGLPWSQHLFEVEKEQNIQPPLKYVIFEDDNFRVRCIPVNVGSFVCRQFLPESWAGLRDEALENACGIKGAVFVHSVRFIGGHKTKEGAIKMARKSLELGKLSLYGYSLFTGNQIFQQFLRLLQHALQNELLSLVQLPECLLLCHQNQGEHRIQIHKCKVLRHRLEHRTRVGGQMCSFCLCNFRCIDDATIGTYRCTRCRCVNTKHGWHMSDTNRVPGCLVRLSGKMRSFRLCHFRCVENFAVVDQRHSEITIRQH
ncbi:unnamed protein product [Heterotrigona itama]|uniref:Uncharacterized protein n=1 Tax=Heterotrigona itama TaxID=395501 RepID=A0A6V7H2I7_9HYME|nr:unnamed protein product [Heterotrigona itama]